MVKNEVRNLYSWERKILDKLLDQNFLGSNELCKQLSDCKVSVLDEDGSLKFYLRDTVKKAEMVKGRIPIEAEVRDQDGEMVQILLHVVDGMIDELEFWKSDGSAIKRDIEPDDLKIVLK